MKLNSNEHCYIWTCVLCIELREKYLDLRIFYFPEIEGDALVAQAAVFFTGGFETSSTTMAFALYELARNPEMQTKLREEILKTLKKNDGKVTYDLVK